jgi:hypothetical protein
VEPSRLAARHSTMPRRRTVDGREVLIARPAFLRGPDADDPLQPTTRLPAAGPRFFRRRRAGCRHPGRSSSVGSRADFRANRSPPWRVILGR